MTREYGLQARMVLAILLALALYAATAAGLVWLVAETQAGPWILAGVVAMVALGAAAVRDLARRERRNPRRRPETVRAATEADQLRVGSALQRLALLAQAPIPRFDVAEERALLSWTTAPPGSPPTVHVTTGLLDRLPDRELQAVLGHELGHVLNRDARVMSVLAGPPTYLVGGLVSVGLFGGDYGGMLALCFGALVGAPVALLIAAARIVSRHRELAADRVAAMLVGSPAAVASALLAVDAEIGAIPKGDLRRFAARDDLHFVPVKRRTGLRAPWSTHPATESRIERLQALEAGIHG